MEALYVTIAFMSGLLPALFWLWFWLREDKERPEPYLLIALAFLGGIMVVPIVLPLQKLAVEYYYGPTLIFIWVVIEEVMKYAAALLLVLWNKAVDEPIDLIIYMITVALGFAALENALFIFTPISNGDITGSILTGNFRFLGAMLLHVLASGTVGIALALSYYKPPTLRLWWGTVGLAVAITLHALFNFFIMNAGGGVILAVFLCVWVGLIGMMLFFEKAKILEAQHRRWR